LTPPLNGKVGSKQRVVCWAGPIAGLDTVQNIMSSPSGKESRLHGRSAFSVITKQFIYEFPFDKITYSLKHNTYNNNNNNNNNNKDLTI